MLVLIVVVVLAVAAIGVTAYFALAPRPTEKVLVVGTIDDERTFDPADAYDYFSINIIQNTMAMLLTYVPGTSTLKPDILSEIPSVTNGGISSDGLTYTLRIRPGVEFEDGTAIDAAIVNYSFQRAMKLEGEPWFLLDAIDTVQETGDLTVRVTLSRPWSPFVSLLAFSITAPVHPSLTDDRFYPNVIISSGPYRLAKYIPHQRYELEANPNYYGTPAVTSKVVIVRYTTAVDLKLAIQTGEIDIAYRSLDPQDFNALKADTSLRTLEGDSPFIRYVVFNVCSDAGVTASWCPRATPFADERIRQALAYATDRADIIQSAYAGTVSALYSLVPGGMPFHTDAFSDVYGTTPDLTEARALLTAAGFSETSKLAFTLWYTPSHYGGPEILVAQALKRAWEATNMVTVTLDTKEWADYIVAWLAGDFDVFLLGWFPDYFDSDNFVFPFLHSASGGTASFGNFYQNVTMDGVIEDQGASADPLVREPLFEEIQSGLAYDAPYIPLFQSKQVVVFRPNVSGIVLDPIQFFRYFVIDVA